MKNYTMEEQYAAGRLTLAECCLRVIGMTHEIAFGIISSNGHKCRTTMRDGKGMIGTCDMQPERINFHVKNGIIIKAYLG
jgi:hypothetical protein